MSIKNIINDYISTIMDKNIDIKNPTKWNLIKEDIEAMGFQKRQTITSLKLSGKLFVQNIKKENNMKLFNKK